MYTIYVISLISEVDRRKKVKAFFDSINVQYKLIDAIKLENKPNSWKYSIGELSCLKSHQFIYEDVLKNGQNGIIFEDDFICNNAEAFIDFLHELRDGNLSTLSDVMILGYSKVTKLEMKYVHFYNPIVKITRNRKVSSGYIYAQKKFGALAYVITPKGASKLLKINQDAFVADDWPSFENQVDIKHVTPLLFREDFEGLKSSLEKERNNTYNRSMLRLMAKLFVGFFRYFIFKNLVRR